MGLWGNNKSQPVSTQSILPFGDIRNGIVITKKAELRAILMVSSINFALKSEQEQSALIFAYQNFLNSLEFPIQIVMQSKKLDLSHYLAKLKNSATTQTNELLRIQTLDYMDFIARLVNIANIMDKKFYVTVPFMPPPQMNSLPGSKSEQTPQMTPAEFNSYKEELSQRVQVVQSGLSSVGLRSEPLNTQQVVELLYGIYNSEEANKEKLPPVAELNANVIKIKGANEPAAN